jgi:uncharacterized protein
MKALIAAALLALAAPVAATSALHARTRELSLHGTQFTVELATTPAQRDRGLMQRRQLAPDQGMLFVFPGDGLRWFWMKDTLIPLDMLFFDAQRRLVSMQLDVPPCKGDPCPTYPSGRPARYVLELPAGTVARLGIQAGDVFTLKGQVGPVH